MEILNACPVCKSSTFLPFLSCKDYTASKEDFSIVACSSCGFKFTNPRPAQHEIGRYYQVDNYISHSGTQSGIINKVYHQVRKYTLKQKLNLINRLSPKGDLLDIGCGTGHFLEVAKNDGWEITGIEPDPIAQKTAIELIGNSIFDEDHLDKKESACFNIITMWHVLEHVHNLDKRIATLKRLLAPGGSLIIAVPNCNSKDAAHYQQYWGAYDVPRHLYHFTPKTIKLLFENNGFKLEEVLPMKFDSFYVSMLSEKYKGGNMIAGILQGLSSNLHASSNFGTYSSQIYVLKHK